MGLRCLTVRVSNRPATSPSPSSAIYERLWTASTIHRAVEKTAEHDEFCVRAGRICYTPARRVQAVNAVLCSIGIGSRRGRYSQTRTMAEIPLTASSPIS